jgi:hypothetical protein
MPTQIEVFEDNSDYAELGKKKQALLAFENPSFIDAENEQDTSPAEGKNEFVTLSKSTKTMQMQA